VTGNTAAPYDIVIPTIGRPSLAVLLESLSRARGPWPNEVIVVDDRRVRSVPLELGAPGALRERIRVVPGPAAGPAAARNRGWQLSRAPWIAFLDDDVVVGDDWPMLLQADLAACSPRDAGSQGKLRVPLPSTRKATDWERNVHALQGARWITADCAYRRSALESVRGFDERFPRAYREDADLALRFEAQGRRVVLGARRSDHPVRAADPWVSVRLQAGNADDALMERLHGAAWRERAASPRGAFPRHALTVASAVCGLAFTAVWAVSTARFAWQRIAAGPRDPREIGTMLASSVAIPFAAVYHYTRGRARLGRVLARTRPLPVAVLFDRDGTLIEDDPALRDPRDVRPMAGAAEALGRLRAAGMLLGIVTNQPRVGEGTLEAFQLDAIHARLDALLGPFATWAVCAHAREALCACRKPQPGLVTRAAHDLGIDPSACVVVGDIGSDVDAATAAGARTVLIPTAVTRPEEIARAPFVAATLQLAVDAILGGRV
jgi:histidinol-phosphate phosphatase family protein